MNCDCDDKCCNLYNDIDDDDNQYLIDRLEDIIEISEFLIQVIKHQKIKKDTCDTILRDLKKEDENDKEENNKEENDTFVYKTKDKENNNINEEVYRKLLEYMLGKYPYTYYDYPPKPRTWEYWF